MHLILRSELAKREKVARSTVSRACQGPLRPAMVGLRVNLDHPACRAWLEGQSDKRRRAVAESAGVASDLDEPLFPTDLQPAESTPFEHGHLTLRELSEAHGTHPANELFLRAWASLQEAARKELAVEELELSVLPTPLAQILVDAWLTHIDQLVGHDLPGELTAGLQPLLVAGAPRALVQTAIQDSISTKLKTVKSLTQETVDAACRTRLRPSESGMESTTELRSMTIDALLQRFTSASMLHAHTKALNVLFDGTKKEFEISLARRQLLLREDVTRELVSKVEQLCRRLLADTPTALVDVVQALHSTGCYTEADARIRRTFAESITAARTACDRNLRRLLRRNSNATQQHHETDRLRPDDSAIA